jgi:hypothetical protein
MVHRTTAAGTLKRVCVCSSVIMPGSTQLIILCSLPPLLLVLLQTMPYRLNEETGLIDYDMLEKTAKLFRPKLIVAGGFYDTSVIVMIMTVMIFVIIISSSNSSIIVAAAAVSHRTWMHCC